MDTLEGPAPQSGRPWVKVVIVLGALVLLCCGGALIFLVPKAVEFASLTPEEQQDQLSGVVEDLTGDRDLVARTFLDHLKAGDLDAALALTTPAFRDNVGHDGLADVQRKVDEVMGALDHVRLQSFNMRRSGFGKSSTTIDLIYKGVYANGDGTVTIQLIESETGGVEVDTYRVDSPLFDRAPTPAEDE